MLRYVVSWLLLSTLPAAVSGAIPLQLNHQGVVRVNGLAFSGNGDFRFGIVDPDTGNNLWTNDGTQVPGPGTPTNAVNLPVINGIYNVRLGDAMLPNMTAVPSTVFNDDNVVLRIWFDDTQGNGVGQLSPDHVLTSAPYAFRALNSDLAGFATTAGDADTVDGHQGDDLEESAEIDADVAAHTASADAHHPRYSDAEAVTAFLADAASQPGDLFVHGPTGLERLAPGSAGQVLTSQGPAVTPVWTTPGSGNAQFATGTYSGNGQHREILVGFAPDVVMIVSSEHAHFVIIEDLKSLTAVLGGFLTGNGFTIVNVADNGNNPGVTYNWAAFRGTN